MRLSLSAILKSAVLPPECEKVIVNLLEISHSSFGTIRICDRNSDFDSKSADGVNTHTYTAWAFAAGLNDEADGDIPNPVIAIDCIDQSILVSIYGAMSGDIREKIVIKHWFVTEDQPDINQLPRQVSYNVTDIDVEEDENGCVMGAHLELVNVSNAEFPAHGFLPQWFAGLFAGVGS